MSFKDVVVLVDSSSEAASRYALSLASSFDAHLTVAAVVVDPTASIGLTEASAAFVTSVLEKARNAARTAMDEVATGAGQAGIQVGTELVEAGIATVGDAIGRLLRYFDLTIIEQPNPEMPGDKAVMIGAALFGSGRPLLVVPYIQKESLRLQNVMVAWDGSATAARAVGDATPLLARAKRVEVITVDNPPGENGDMPAAQITRHLARHGIHAAFRVLPSAGDVANTLLSSAFDSGADLLVMGGYGHSRFRELVLGGATRGILQSMTLPVLMSH